MGIKMIHELSGNLLRKVDVLCSDHVVFLLLAFTCSLGHISLFLHVASSPQFLLEVIRSILGKKFLLLFIAYLDRWWFVVINKC